MTDLTLRYVEFAQLPYEVWRDKRLLAAFACKPHLDRFMNAPIGLPIAQVDTHPKGGDALAAPSPMGSPVAESDAPNDQSND